MNKKRFLAFAIIAIVSLAAAGTAFGQSDSADLTLQGYVGVGVNVQVSSTNNATDLDLDVDNSSNPVKVADLSWSTNASSGYTLSASGSNDANSSFNFAGTDNSGTLEYSLLVGGTGYAPGENIRDAGGPTGGAVTEPVEITYNGNGQGLPSGHYQDTITFTITAK